MNNQVSLWGWPRYPTSHSLFIIHFSSFNLVLSNKNLKNGLSIYKYTKLRLQSTRSLRNQYKYTSWKYCTSNSLHFMSNLFLYPIILPKCHFLPLSVCTAVLVRTQTLTGQLEDGAMRPVLTTSRPLIGQQAVKYRPLIGSLVQGYAAIQYKCCRIRACVCCLIYPCQFS